MTDIGEVLVKHLGLIGQLSDGDKDALLSIKGEVRDLQRGEDVLKVGDRPSQAVVVFNGLLQRYTALHNEPARQAADPLLLSANRCALLGDPAHRGDGQHARSRRTEPDRPRPAS